MRLTPSEVVACKEMDFATLKVSNFELVWVAFIQALDAPAPTFAPTEIPTTASFEVGEMLTPADTSSEALISDLVRALMSLARRYKSLPSMGWLPMRR